MSKIRVEEWESNNLPEEEFSLKDSFRNLYHDLANPQERPKVFALGGAILLATGVVVQSAESMIIDQSGHINELTSILEGSGIGLLVLAGITYCSVSKK